MVASSACSRSLASCETEGKALGSMTPVRPLPMGMAAGRPEPLDPPRVIKPRASIGYTATRLAVNNSLTCCSCGPYLRDEPNVSRGDLGVRPIGNEAENQITFLRPGR